MGGFSVESVVLIERSHVHTVTKSQVETSQNSGYKKLLVWQKADALAREIYLVTKSFPKEEAYGITSQLRRSALSVCLNIVEGSGRQGKKELKNFINIALGSIAEVDYLIDFSIRLGYIADPDQAKLTNLRSYVGALLWKFYKSL